VSAPVSLAVIEYLALEAAFLIANGAAYKREMKAAEARLFDAVNSVGGVARVGALTVQAHECREGGNLIGRWLTFQGAAMHDYHDAANTAAHSRLLTPWKRGLLTFVENQPPPKASAA
jgi:hypothetical protein